MHLSAMNCRMLLAIISFGCLTDFAHTQEALTLRENFAPGHASKVDVAVKITGRLAVPLEKGKQPELVTLNGVSRLAYDERVLAPDNADSLKTVRAYRDIHFMRTVGNITQDADIRPSVRRMVVVKSGGRRAPFSPDGALTWGEIDVVRTDVFNPSAVAGLLPPAPVRKGQKWRATQDAVAELTDMEKLDEGDIVVEFVGVTEVGGRRVARLQVSGTVRGINQDGPNRQKLEGSAYFDIDAACLTYLSLKGTRELLDGNGTTTGRIEGQFTMNRTPIERLPADLSDSSLRGLDLSPSLENTLLLYDDPRLGVRFLYPRGWRVGVVQGKQVTLDHARGSGILLTVEAPAKLPSADDYAREVLGFLEKQQAKITGSEKPSRVRANPGQLDRFALEATIGAEKARLEYAVLKQTEGGVTVAARIPDGEATAIRPEVERIMRSVAVTKPIEEK